MSAVIRHLQIENVKRIKALKITPAGSTVKITGKNDQGKSSVLDSIDYAFCGKICDQPIREGQARGRIFLELSEELKSVFTVEKIFRPSGSELIVRNVEGVSQKSPQGLLDELYNRVMFDPLSFVRLKPMEQVETLRKLAGLDFTQINSDRQRAYDERTVKGRELEAAKQKLEAFKFDPTAPKQARSAVELAEKLASLQRINQGNTEKRDAQNKRGEKITSLGKDITRIKTQIANIEKMLSDAKNSLTSKETELTNESSTYEAAKIDISKLQDSNEVEVRQQLKNIEDDNGKIAANKLHTDAKKEFDDCEKAVKDFTKAIEEFDQTKRDMIEFASFPMDGLSFDEERGVLLNGIPFAQGSSARQLQAAVSIGLALNPQIRVIIIRDGSLLDADSKKSLSELAEKLNAQLWIEIVDDKGPSSVVIEDGEIQHK